MRARLLALLLAGAVAGALVLPASAGAQADDTPPTDPPGPIEQLFVQPTGGGRMVSEDGDDYRLVLTDVSSRVTSFSDRPARVAASLAVEDFVKKWDDGAPFATDPPNAALVIDDAAESRDTFVVELTSAEYDADADRLEYAATLIDEASGRLGSFDAQADERPPAKFGRASLFIDSSPAFGVNVTLAGIEPGSELIVSYSEGVEVPVSERVISGPLNQILTAANAWGAFAEAGGTGNLTVEIESLFCVNPGTTSVPVNVQGTGQATISFEGVGAQVFTAGRSTLQVPSGAQLNGCE